MANLKPTPGRNGASYGASQLADSRALSISGELRNVCSNGEKKTQEKTGLRSQFVEMSIGQDTFGDTFLGMDNLGRGEEWKWLKCQRG